MSWSERARGAHPMVELVTVEKTVGWDEATAGADAELFLSRRWLRTVGNSFDLTFEAAVQRDESGRIVGALPFSRIDDIRGPRVVILPFSDYVIPVIGSQSSWSELIEPILALGDPVSITTTAESHVMNDEQFFDDGAAIRQVVLLDKDPDELMRGFASHHRRLVRRAHRAGITFRNAESIAEVREFYELHLGVRRHKYRLLAQPFGLFETLWEQFLAPGHGALILGFDGETVAGGCLLLEAGDTMYYKYAASHPDHRSVGVSHAAVMQAIRFACQRGFRQLDLGRSDLDQPGLVDFKKRFGAAASDLRRFRSKDRLYREPPEIDDVLAKMTAILTDPSVPDPVTEQAGEALYGYFA